MRIVVDYRPALRERSGAGEYTHRLVAALLSLFHRGTPERALDVSLFSSSWKNRLQIEPALVGAATIDRRIPVRLLNLSWHRAEWPTVESLAGCDFDVAHSSHPLLMPTRRAAQVVTIHDLNFLKHPELTRAEIRRDYPALARDHARRADGIIVPSQFTAGEVIREFGVEAGKVAVCPPGAPDWTPRQPQTRGAYVLFLSTLEPRKNVAGLLDAYERLLADATRARRVPDLLLAGKATAAAREWLARLERPPLRGRVRHVGYVDPAARRDVYAGARLLVQPSFEEGFGLPVLEAMTLGVPVVASNRGSLPEVLGGAGPLVEPDDPEAIAAAIEQLATDDEYATLCSSRGIARAASFRWETAATRVYELYQRAVERRRCASA
jgi:glycosyltransferase involved in cell wall biosynthesis